MIGRSRNARHPYDQTRARGQIPPDVSRSAADESALPPPRCMSVAASKPQAAAGIRYNERIERRLAIPASTSRTHAASATRDPDSVTSSTPSATPANGQDCGRRLLDTYVRMQYAVAPAIVAPK